MVDEDNFAHEITPGSDDIIIRWRDCKRCNGRGWVMPIVHIFAEYNKRYYQCKCCLETKRYFDKHGCLPETKEVT